MKTLLLAALCFVVAPVLIASSAKPRVLICGGSMMNGDHFADSVLPVMREHYQGVKKVALVLHASLPADRDRMERRLQEAFRHLAGIDAESLHRHDSAGRRALLQQADGIFVGGGETFVLLAELYRAGELELIRARVAAGIPYGGSSAGANVAGVLIGTTNDFPTTDIPSRRALGIFPAVINPHHPGPNAAAEQAARAGKIRGYLRFNPDEVVLALADTSVARWRDGRMTLDAGQGWIYRHDGVTELKLGEAVAGFAP